MPTHNEVLKKYGYTTRQLTDNIVRAYDRSTEAQKLGGRQWYCQAEMHAKILAESAGSKEHAAAVISHLSPRTKWDTNLKAAYSLIQTGDASRVFKRSKALAHKALKSDKPLETINGPKCQSFAANILGDQKRVTVDVWAMRTALGKEIDLNKSMYRAIEYAFQLAAKRVGETPRNLQAIVWLVERSNR